MKTMIRENRARANYLCYIIALAAFIIGVGLGASGARGLDSSALSEAKDAAKLLTASLSLGDVLRTVALSGVLWSAALFIFASAPLLAPFASVMIALRGFAVGFCSALLLLSGENMAIAAFLLPQCLLTLPAMCAVCAASTERAMRGSVPLRKIAVLCALLVLAALIEAFVSYAVFSVFNR